MHDVKGKIETIKTGWKHIHYPVLSEEAIAIAAFRKYWYMWIRIFFWIVLLKITIVIDTLE